MKIVSSENVKVPDQQEETKEVKKEPIGITLNMAQADMTMAIIQIQNAYGLPAYLTDLVVTAALADIRTCAKQDILNILHNK